MNHEKPGRPGETPQPEPAEPTDDSIPVPPDQQPVYPIEDPPASHPQAPINEGPKGPKKIVSEKGGLTGI
jgi:hypothetical protein